MSDRESAGRIAESAKRVGEELTGVLRRLDCERMAGFVDAVDAADRVFVAAAGRSGLMARAFVMRLVHLGMAAHMVGDVTTPAIGKGDLLVVVSGSGETGGLVYIAGKAKQANASVALLTGHSGSSLAERADYLALVPLPVDSSSQPMGNLFEQSALLILDVIAMELLSRGRSTLSSMRSRHANLE